MVRVAAKMVKEYSEAYALKKDCLWVIYTIGVSQELKDSIAKAANECGFASIVWVQANGVITTHGGPAAVGIAGFNA